MINNILDDKRGRLAKKKPGRTLVILLAMFLILLWVGRGALQKAGLWGCGDPVKYVWVTESIPPVDHCEARLEEGGKLFPCDSDKWSLDQIRSIRSLPVREYSPEEESLCR